MFGGGDPFGGGGGGFNFQFNQGGGGGRGGRRGHHFDDEDERGPRATPLFENTDVIQLDLASIFKFYRRKEIWVMYFHKSNEQASIDLKDEYKTLAEKMYGIIKVGAIDCSVEEELCEEFSVYSTPAIKIFTEKLSDDGADYKGKKEWKAISASASAKM